MHKFDFLSGAPKTFIFGKSSNKTNLGGVFTLIYLIIVLIISLAYIVDYELNPKYEAQLSSKHFFITDIDYFDNKEKDEKLNPKLSFHIDFESDSIEKSEFIIYQGITVGDELERRKIEFGKEYKSFSNDFNFFFGYKCKNTSCLPPKDDTQEALNVYAFSIYS